MQRLAILATRMARMPAALAVPAAARVGIAVAVWLLLAGCAGESEWTSSHAPPPGGPTAAPGWVETGEHPDYPSGQFGVGFGVSDEGGDAADERAQRQIRGTIEAAIRHEVRVWLPPRHGGEPEDDDADGSEEESDAQDVPEESEDPGAESPDDPGEADDDPDSADEGDEADNTSADDGSDTDSSPTDAQPDDEPAVRPAEVLAGVSQMVVDLALEWLSPQRVDWYTDGFTTYVLHTVNLDGATRTLQSQLPAADADPRELPLETLIRVAAARLVLRYLHPDAVPDDEVAAGDANGAGDPDPWLAALADRWLEVAERNAAMDVSTDASRLPLRIRRGEPADVMLHIRCRHVNADGVRFIRLHAQNLDGVCTLSLGSSPTPGGRRYVAPAPPSRDATSGEALWEQGMDVAASADNLVPIRVIPLEADAYRGRLRLRVSDVPAAFERWWLTFPVPVLDLSWRVPARDRLQWRSEVELIVDGERQPPELMVSLLRALLIRAGFDDLARRHVADGTDGPEDGRESPPDPGVFTLTFRGQVVVTSRERSGADVRSAVEIELDDTGPSLEAVPVRADSPTGDAVDALRQALSRPSAAQAVRRAVSRAAR